METLKISKEKAIELYPTAGKAMQEVFEQSFGKKTFIKDIRDRVKSFEDALDLLPANDKDVVSYNAIKDISEVEQHIKDNQKRIIIAKALNEGWTPDWSNTNEYKYFPYFKHEKSGFGFSDSGYYYWRSATGVGSRLCFKTEELSDYFGKQFIDLHESVLTLKNK